MSCVEKLPCPQCKSSDSLQVFYNEQYDSYTSFCFGSCNELKGDPYSDRDDVPRPKTKDKNQIFAEIQEIKKLPKMPMAHRKIPAKFLQKWGVRYAVSEYDGKTPWACFFGYTVEDKLVGWKATSLRKKAFWGVGSIKDVEPFGWTRAVKVNARRLYITEGEWDAISLDYALTKADENTKYSSMKYSIISLPAGSGSMTSTLKTIRQKIKSTFKEVVLVLDNDEAGKEAEKVARKLLPSILRVDLPPGCKDASDAVQKSLHYELAKAVKWGAHKPPIRGVIQVADVMARALEDPGLGLSYPYEQLNDLTLGQRYGECTGIGAGVSIGKTALCHEFAAHNIVEHGVPCFAVLLEEQNHMTVRNVAGKIDSQPYHRPDLEYDRDQFIDTAHSLQGKLLLWESDEDQEMRFDIDEIIEAIRFNTAEYGCRFHYIDNMTRLVDHLSASDANEFINKYSSVLEGLSVQLDIHIDVFSHLNNNGKVAHESGGQVSLHQFTGSRGMMRSFASMMGFERNKDAGDRAHNSFLRVLKNRKYGIEGKLKLKYKPNTGRLTEEEWLGDDLSADGF
jgi:twinkle protein